MHLKSLVFFLSFIGLANAQNAVISTSKGDIYIRLYADKAPITVANFLRYIIAEKFDQGSFFRATTIENEVVRQHKIEVIQGGMAKEQTAFPPIALENTKRTGISHLDGTLSMARSGVDTAQDSFFICINDQPELDFGGKRQDDGQGFAAFGRVTKGMDVVRLIQQGPQQGQRLITPIIIHSILLLLP